jgi:uncharacterized protein YktB (UPF0637 family)
MQQIYAHVRPKLLRLGDELTPQLARMLHMEFFPHVAKHMRRTVNPPPETWAAFGPSPRGYKRYGYLALCVSGAGIHARVVVKPEADKRQQMARNLYSQTEQLVEDFRGTRLARYDTWDFHNRPTAEVAEAGWFSALAGTLDKKSGGVDIGFGWNFRESLRLERDELLEAFRELEPLYQVLCSV